MFFYEGCTCPVCGQLFQETDDIVTCPQCGAPHHRECWKQEGHCHFQQDHGTERQWKRPEPEPPAPAPTPTPSGAETQTDGKTCPSCGMKNPEFSEFCSRCGHELPAGDWTSQEPSSGPTAPPPGPSYPPPPSPGGYGEYMPFRVPLVDPFGGVPKEEQIDGVTAEDLAAITGNNSAYYVSRFHKMANGGSKCSWNWPAFLLTPYWLLYRKCYLSGALVLLLQVARTLISTYIMQFQILPLLGDSATLGEMYQSLFQAMSGENSSLLLFSVILSLMTLTDLLIRVLFGLAGNYWYMRTCISRVKKRRQEKPDLYPQELTAVGGTSFLLGVSSYAILYFVSMLISLFFLRL